MVLNQHLVWIWDPGMNHLATTSSPDKLDLGSVSCSLSSLVLPSAKCNLYPYHIICHGSEVGTWLNDIQETGIRYLAEYGLMVLHPLNAPSKNRFKQVSDKIIII